MLYICPICDKEFGAYEDMRDPNGTGNFWCKSCQDEHDSIDWGAESDRRLH